VEMVSAYFRTVLRLRRGVRLQVDAHHLGAGISAGLQSHLVLDELLPNRHRCRRPVPIQLSWLLTSTQPTKRRLRYVLTPSANGNAQFVPPPPFLARRSAKLRIVSCGSSLTWYALSNDDAVSVLAQDGCREQHRHVHATDFAGGAAATVTRDRALSFGVGRAMRSAASGLGLLPVDVESNLPMLALFSQRWNARCGA
jgi:hypothetical protein